MPTGITSVSGGAPSSFTGLASGIDTQALVDSITAQAKAPGVQWQKQIDANTARKTALDTLAQNLSALSAAGSALKYGAGFNVYAVNAVGTDATGRNVLAATATTAASAGSYAVAVQQLAQAQKTVGSVALASSTTALGVSGGLTLTKTGGGSVTVPVASADSLATLRTNINAVQGTTGVQASIVSSNPDGSGAHLILTSVATGAANGFTATDAAGTTPSLTATLGLGAPAVAAQDAKLTIDGVAVTRPSNTASDAISGVTLSLGALGNGIVTLTRQPDQAQAAVQTFVDAYNKVRQFIQQQQSPQADGTYPPLHNDPSLNGARSQLATIALTAGAAANGVSPTLATLGAAGVSVQRDGTLKLDAPTFQSAFQNRLADVSSLFTDRMTAFSTYADATATPFLGTISARESGIDTQSAHLQSRIDTLNARVDKRRLALLAQYAKFEASLSKIQAAGTGLSAQLASLTKN